MNEKAKALIKQLGGELRNSGELDSETAKLLQDIEANLDSDPDSLADRVKELETRFAARHPTAERIVRSIIDSLGKMGI